MFKTPLSNRAIENRELLENINFFWEESGRIYGYRKIHQDLLDEGFKVGENRIHRIRKANRMRAKIGKKQRKMKYGAPSKVSENVLKQQFNAGKPNEIWFGDTTYIRTLVGWLYLAAVIDLFSRKVVGWAMSARNNSKLTVDSIQMAVEHRKVEGDLVFHSDQGVQYSSIPFLSALK